MRTRSKIQKQLYSLQEDSSSSNFSCYSFIHNPQNSSIFQSDDVNVKQQSSQSQSVAQPQTKKKYTASKKEKTLNELTKKFLKLIHSAENQTISANYASDKLGICKRRTYDLTNILEGFGLVQKVKCRKFKWINLEDQQFQEILKLGKGIYESNKKTKTIENEIELMKQKIRKFLVKYEKYIDSQDKQFKKLLQMIE